MKVYYNCMTNQFGLAEDHWDIIATIKFIPVVSRHKTYNDVVISYVDERRVPLEIATPRTEEWEEVGEF